MEANIPQQVRFAASRPAFEQLASEKPASGAIVGLFNVYDFERTTFGYQFQVACSSGLACTGFAYSPDGPPGPEVEPLEFGVTSYRHLDGPWYIWAERYT